MILYICFGIGSERNISPTNEVAALQRSYRGRQFTKTERNPVITYWYGA